MRGFRRHVLILFYIIHDKVTLCCGPGVYQRGEYFKSFVFVLSPSVSLFYSRCWLERDSEMKSKNRIGCEGFASHTPQTRHIYSAMYHRKTSEDSRKGLLLGIECTSPAFLNSGSQQCIVCAGCLTVVLRFVWLFVQRRRYHWMQLQSKMEQDRIYVF